MTISTRVSSVLQGLHACPYCLSSNTKDSGWKNSGEKAGRFWLKPVRCRNCHKRFVRYRRVPLAVVAGGLVLGFSVLVGVIARDVDSNLPTEHERKLAELEPREAERRRAETGNAGAQFDYAMLLAQGGAGEPEDLVESIQWLEKAAVQGHAQAQFELALAYKLGRGTLQDYSAAARWFDTAARKQHVAAQYHMGRLHRIGEGVELDLMRAYAWFNRAASQGHGAARGARDEIAASLKPEQVVQAQQLSRALQISLPPGSAEAPLASTELAIPPTDERADKP